MEHGRCYSQRQYVAGDLADAVGDQTEQICFGRRPQQREGSTRLDLGRQTTSEPTTCHEDSLPVEFTDFDGDMVHPR